MPLLHELSREYPNLQFSITTVSSINGSGEYYLSHKGHYFSIKASSKLAKSHSLNQLYFALKSRQVADLLGLNKPLFSLRPLWICKTRRFRLPSMVEIDLPDWLEEAETDHTILLEKGHELLIKCIELGMNCLIFSPLAQSEIARSATLSWRTLRLFLDYIRDQEIKIGLHFHKSFSRIDPGADVAEIAAATKVLQNSFDFYVVHQGDFYDKLSQQTEYEAVKQEISILEKELVFPLIYHLTAKDIEEDSKKQSLWMKRLSEEMGSTTHLSFAVDPPLFSFTEKVHPYLLELSSQESISFSKLIPVFSLSEAQHIPFCNFAFYDNVIGRQKGGRFYGMALAVSGIAPQGSFSSLAAWVFGNRMWESRSVQVLIEQWIYSQNQELLPLFQEGIVSEISALLSLYGKVCRATSHTLSGKPKIEQLSGVVERLALQLQSFSLFLLGLTKGGNLSERNRPFLAAFSNSLQSMVKEKIESTCQEFGLKIPHQITQYQSVTI